MKAVILWIMFIGPHPTSSTMEHGVMYQNFSDMPTCNIMVKVLKDDPTIKTAVCTEVVVR